LIIEMNRGHIRYRHSNKRLATIGVEALVPGHGGGDFVIYRNSVTHWDTPHVSMNPNLYEVSEPALLRS